MQEQTSQVKKDAGSLGLMVLFRGSEEELLLALDTRIAHRYYKVGETYKILIAKAGNSRVWLYRILLNRIPQDAMLSLREAGFTYKIVEIYKEDPKRPSYLRVVK